ncbi:MAG: methyltransferase domain-containing protein [Actinomycetota bacterium]
MKLYDDRVLPRILNRTCGSATLEPLRRRVCEGLAGDVIELGFGSGHNIPFYPRAVTRVSAVEPSDISWRLAGERLRASTILVQRSGLDGQLLPFQDNSHDAALSTWTLCTIPDPAAALAELRRVLRPGGTLHFLEHGLAPEESIRRWQRHLNPVQKLMAGGCQLTRPIADMLTAAGFTITSIDVFYEEGTAKIAGADSLGTALSP